MNLNYQTVLILIQIFKIVSNYIIKTHETLTAIPPIHVNINISNNRLVFSVKR